MIHILYLHETNSRHSTPITSWFQYNNSPQVIQAKKRKEKKTVMFIYNFVCMCMRKHVELNQVVYFIFLYHCLFLIWWHFVQTLLQHLPLAPPSNPRWTRWPLEMRGELQSPTCWAFLGSWCHFREVHWSYSLRKPHEDGNHRRCNGKLWCLTSSSCTHHKRNSDRCHLIV